MGGINEQSASAREAARRSNGEFGELPLADPGNSMLGDELHAEAKSSVSHEASDGEPFDREMAMWTRRAQRRTAQIENLVGTFDDIPTTRNEVWAYADRKASELGESRDTDWRDELWNAIVRRIDPSWVVGYSERLRLLRRR